MRPIGAIIIDDEQSACDILSSLIERFTMGVQVVGVANDLTEGVRLIERLNPDVVFLDIQMPRYSGFEILSFFPEPTFEIIFVTAFDHYAVRAFEISAVDYLLKPIGITKLQSAIEKLHEKIAQNQLEERYDLLLENLKHEFPTHIQVSTHQGKERLLLSSIQAFEADESYTKIHLNNHKLVSSKNLKQFEHLLSNHPDFLRVHKSWIINLNEISEYSKSSLEIKLRNGLTARLSRIKKNQFESFLTAKK
jgi:two-component system LytT family response regulator